MFFARKCGSPISINVHIKKMHKTDGAKTNEGWMCAVVRPSYAQQDITAQ